MPPMVPLYQVPLPPLPPPLNLMGACEEEDVAHRQAKETPRQGSQKPQIKLTLIKKALPLSLTKKEEPVAPKIIGDKGWS